MGTADLNEQTCVATSEKWPGMSMTWESVRALFHENARKMQGTDHRDSGVV